MPLTTIKSSNIKDAEVKDVDISPTAAIASSKVSGLDTSQLETNAFNIGILGFKIAVNDGVTIFNLVDGIVDEFHDETGIDTAENSLQPQTMIHLVISIKILTQRLVLQCISV